MSTPLKDIVSQYNNAYNFYCSQLMITIKRAFGILVHRYAILHRPLTCPLKKVSPLVMCLCRLHNFCIDYKDRDAVRSSNNDAIFAVKYIKALSNRVDDYVSKNVTLVRLERGRPNTLLHKGNHFKDAPRNRTVTTDRCPMDDMIEQLKRLNLVCPSPVS